MSLIPSQYPDDAVELTVTFLIPVTDDNVNDIDGCVHDALEGKGLTWWPTQLARYHKEHGRVLEFGFTRPPEFPRPKAPRRKKDAAADPVSRHTRQADTASGAER